jgi:hypothetical protein
VGTATAHTGLVTVGGRDYATPAAWAAITPGTTPDQVRRAAMLGRLPGGISVSPGGKITAYPVDVLGEWERRRRSGETDTGGRRAGDMSTVAAKLGVSKMRVWRAVRAGLIAAEKDDSGAWQLDAASVEAWAASGMPAPRASGHR